MNWLCDVFRNSNGKLTNTEENMLLQNGCRTWKVTFFHRKYIHGQWEYERMLNMINREIQFKPQWHSTFHLLERLLPKRKKLRVGKDEEKRKFCGNINCYSHYDKWCKDSSKIKNRTTICSTIPFLGIYPKEKSIFWRNIHNVMFIVAIFIITKCIHDDHKLSDNQCLNGYIPTMECYKLLEISCHLQQQEWTWRPLCQLK
jgi:hypothetical protein